ncbi:3-hydroxyisobutyrate dehydrogenase [Dyadobacter soli]|uniref:3-hydroxyisobutyrate dehydrogenase n=1 Tax=Dyadobacter soli TaxID=659014 RepID=A0A1G7VJ55_9BACT|nr:NAD(P)-binding domain-containing protein [Dyadobacter soli]SDG59835.1 3-hydroxyisobutyrate dehydrogenase [Dyadobacter soli]
MATAFINAKENVTVVGLGSMGAALAGALIENGFQVTVWNRNPAKAEPLVQKGAALATSLAAAIEASPVTVICVSDYKTTNSLIGNREVEQAISGRTIVQLSTGTPGEARELDKWSRANGAFCLNGDILAWPKQIGSSQATISISGDQQRFTEHQAILSALAGNINLMGSEPGASAALFSAVLSYLAGSWIGFCHGALICENQGLRAEEFGKLIQSIAPMLGEESEHMGRVIQYSEFNNPESTIQTTGLDLHLLVQLSMETGISSALPAFAANIFQQAIDAGYGKQEHAAIIKVMRKPAF